MNERFGFLCFTDHLEAGPLVDVALELERLALDSLWIPELFGREPLATAGYLIAKTTRIGVATGIANAYARDALAAAQARRTLAELSGGRFTLGLGVSHPPIAGLRGHEWVAPVKKLGAYLDAIARAELQSPAPAAPAPILIAGHGPKLLALAAQKADGAHTYLVTPAHSKNARGILGEKSLRVVLPFLEEPDPDKAHAAIRAALALYMPFPAYHRMWGTLGFDASDWTGQPSDRLIDAITAWGTAEQIRARAREYVAAGATQVVLSPVQRLRVGSPLFDSLARIVGSR